MTRQEYNVITKEVKDAQDKEKKECPDCLKVEIPAPLGSWIETYPCSFHKEGNYESPAAKWRDENGRYKLSLR